MRGGRLTSVRESEGVARHHEGRALFLGTGKRMARQIDQAELTSLFCARPQNFSWFLGAGASRSAGLPTATDIIWDLKRRHYCREENQEIERQDVQNEAVRARIQSFMDANGFPEQWADGEYAVYFEKIFGEDRERQRRYMRAMLSEERVSLSVGNRVLGALIASGLSRAVFTTNFDSVVEKSVAEVGEKSLAAFSPGRLARSKCGIEQRRVPDLLQAARRFPLREHQEPAGRSRATERGACGVPGERRKAVRACRHWLQRAGRQHHGGSAPRAGWRQCVSARLVLDRAEGERGRLPRSSGFCRKPNGQASTRDTSRSRHSTR